MIIISAALLFTAAEAVPVTPVLPSLLPVSDNAGISSMSHPYDPSRITQEDIDNLLSLKFTVKSSQSASSQTSDTSQPDSTDRRQSFQPRGEEAEQVVVQVVGQVSGRGRRRKKQQARAELRHLEEETASEHSSEQLDDSLIILDSDNTSVPHHSTAADSSHHSTAADSSHHSMAADSSHHSMAADSSHPEQPATNSVEQEAVQPRNCDITCESTVTPAEDIEASVSSVSIYDAGGVYEVTRFPAQSDATDPAESAPAQPQDLHKMPFSKLLSNGRLCRLILNILLIVIAKLFLDRLYLLYIGTVTKSMT